MKNLRNNFELLFGLKMFPKMSRFLIFVSFC